MTILAQNHMSTMVIVPTAKVETNFAFLGLMTFFTLNNTFYCSTLIAKTQKNLYISKKNLYISEKKIPFFGKNLFFLNPPVLFQVVQNKRDNLLRGACCRVDFEVGKFVLVVVNLIEFLVARAVLAVTHGGKILDLL